MENFNGSFKRAMLCSLLSPPVLITPKGVREVAFFRRFRLCQSVPSGASLSRSGDVDLLKWRQCTKVYLTASKLWGGSKCLRIWQCSIGGLLLRSQWQDAVSPFVGARVQAIGRHGLPPPSTCDALGWNAEYHRISSPALRHLGKSMQQSMQ